MGATYISRSLFSKQRPLSRYCSCENFIFARCGMLPASGERINRTRTAFGCSGVRAYGRRVYGRRAYGCWLLVVRDAMNEVVCLLFACYLWTICCIAFSALHSPFYFALPVALLCPVACVNVQPLFSTLDFVVIVMYEYEYEYECTVSVCSKLGLYATQCFIVFFSMFVCIVSAYWRL